VSKDRARARAERERLAAQRAVEQAERDAALARTRARRDRWSLRWRHLRLWQHGPGFRRRREAWGMIGALILGALVLAYLLSRSIAVTVGTALVLLVAAPVLVMLFFDRSRR
jgi:hypothetical protein